MARIAADGALARREDLLAVEEPLELRVGGRALSVTMRTPGHDQELAAGFLVSEGVVAAPGQIARMIHCASPDGENTFNVLDVTLAPGVPAPDASLERHVYTTSSCGVCGKASIDAVRTRSAFPLTAGDPLVRSSLVAALPDRLREAQEIFERTGGLHAAGLFDAATGEPLVIREDVGRHNAVDKVLGWAYLAGMLPLSGAILQVSGRASFELVQKASMAGVPILSAVSAPSSLAVELARDAGLTLAGFVRGGAMVAYSGLERLRVESEALVP